MSATITGMWSAMPTAPNTAEALVVLGSSSSPPLISSLISMKPLMIRNRPPTISTRSRMEMPMPATVKRLAAMCAR
ncbi:hypothetical protein G6F68_018929 [Rhizopus microsporus]|nr:hypothetical protein G6F68_018929 [Rhizopus microsporus]